MRAIDREADTSGITLLGEPWGVGSSQRSDRQAGWVLRGGRGDQLRVTYILLHPIRPSDRITCCTPMESEGPTSGGALAGIQRCF